MSDNNDDSKLAKIIRNADVDVEAFFTVFSKETDRGMAIASVCFLDEILEKLIRAVYRKDKRIKMLFRDNQILHSFHNKVCIAYFSGLVPEAVYEDLKLVGEIRNKFAHSVLETVSLDDDAIANKIYRFKQLPPDFKKEYPPRLAFLLIVVQIGSLLLGFKEGLVKFGKTKIEGMFDTDVATLQGLILTPQEIKKLMKHVPEKS